MLRTNIYLAEEQTARLDQLAAVQHLSRAEIIRRLIDQGSSGLTRSVAHDVEAIRDSYGAATDIVSPIRGGDERDQHLTRIWQS